MEWVGGEKSAVKVQAVQVRCKVNDLVKEETGHFVPFILRDFQPSFPCWPLSGSHIRSVLFFLPLLRLDLRLPEIAVCLGTFPA